MSNIQNVEKCKKCHIPKEWGEEIIIHNSSEYCGKLLRMKKGFSFSMHFHILKQETWYVNYGILQYSWIDTEKGVVHKTFLKQGDVVTQYRGQPHQLEAIEDSEIFEVSTQHFDTDSYRIWKGQKN